MKLSPILALAITLLTTNPLYGESDGQKKNAQTGDINIQADPSIKSSYELSQDETIQYFKDLEVSLKTLGENPSPQKPLSDNSINYLTGVYLYCTIQNGTCPLPLNGILEVDIINNRLAKKSECENMKKFWKQWLSNDMEQRQQYLVKTGYMGIVSEFNKSVRPSFIKCNDTVAKSVEGSSTDAAYFKSRYSSENDPTPKSNITKLVKLLELVKEKVPNVFIATGSGGASKDESADKAGKTAANKAPAPIPQQPSKKK